ncbi:MAG: HEPN domain-containing protein [Chloroflexota bacterium]
MKKGTEHWLALSDYDFDTAKDMLKSGRYVYVVFMCHLSTEKLIKGGMVEFTDIAVPPKIHLLNDLADLAKLSLTDEQRVFLKKLTIEQQKTRYPEDIRTFGKDYTKEYAQSILKQTKDFCEWLLPLIKSA